MEAGNEKDVVRLEGVHSAIELRLLSPTTLLITITGTDTGALGDAPFRRLESDFLRPSLDLFIDARDSRGASMRVSSAWAQWLKKNRRAFTSITMLTGSSFIRLTAEFVRQFAELEDIMQVTTDPRAFDDEVKASMR